MSRTRPGLDRRTSLITLSALPIVGCAVGTGEPAAGPPPLAALTEMRWRVVALQPEPDAAASWAVVEADLTIDAAGTNAFGSGGCNRWRAAATSEAPGRLRFGNAAATMMACTEPGFMERESAFLGSLAAISTYSLDGDELTLEGDGRRIILRAAPP